MPSNIAFDDKILMSVMRVGKFKTKKEAVNQALLELERKLRQKDIVKIFGTIDFDEKYDYKALRSKR